VSSYIPAAVFAAPVPGAPTYSIAITSVTTGPLSVSISGTASSTKFAGQLSDYNVEINWGDGDVSATSTQNFTVSGDDFSGTWSNSHTYTTGGSRTITVKLYHSRSAGHEASADATQTTQVVVPPAALTVIKHVVNDGGGTASAGDFTITVTGTNVSLSSFPGSESGTGVSLDPGSYSVTESTSTDYSSSFSSGCSGTLASGASVTCTITNTYITQPTSTTGTLIVRKVVVNDGGGTATSSNFSFMVNGAATT